MDRHKKELELDLRLWINNWRILFLLSVNASLRFFMPIVGDFSDYGIVLMMMVINFFCGMVDSRKTKTLVSSPGECYDRLKPRIESTTMDWLFSVIYRSVSNL